MADKIEKLYTIPLRGVRKTERINKSKAAVKIVKSYMLKHFKTKETKVSKGINELIWSRGAKNPPAKIKVKIEVRDKVAFAKLPDEVEEKKTEEKPKSRVEAMKEKLQKPGAVQRVVDKAIENGVKDVKASEAKPASPESKPAK